MAFLWGTGLPGPRWQRRGPFQAWRAACKVALLYLYDGPSARYSRLIQISCLLFLEKMCCVLPVGADTADESPPASLTASNQSKGPSTMCPAWKPLLLIVPLRLGINQINPVYIEAFKVSLFFFSNPLLPAHHTAMSAQRSVSSSPQVSWESCILFPFRSVLRCHSL